MSDASAAMNSRCFSKSLWTEEELKQKLEHFKKTISGILSQPYVVTASIGGCVFSDLQNRDKLMEKADAALYAAKKNGRDGYVLKAFNEN